MGALQDAQRPARMLSSFFGSMSLGLAIMRPEHALDGVLIAIFAWSVCLKLDAIANALEKPKE